MNENIEAEVQ